MAIQNQITPRKEVGRAVDYLSPSTQVQVGGGPSSPTVRPSQAVAIPTPYVGRAAKNTELLELAESLGQFNKQINSLAYVVSNKGEEQAKQQGKKDALANTELAREIFKKNIDQATKEGLFPRNAHPDYRLAYIETGAKALTIQGLTEYLDENTMDLTSPDNMEPIGSTMRNRANQWIFDNIQDPRARAVAMESAFPIVQQYEQRRRDEREANFNVANEQAIGQLGYGLVDVIANNSIDPEDPTQQMNRLAATEDYQKLYDTLVRNHPEFKGKQSIMVADSAIAALQSKVRNGYDPRQAITVLNDLSQSIKAGTGAWGDIPDVASKLNGAIVYFENQAVQRDSMGKARQTVQFDLMESRTQTLFRELDDSGELLRMDEGQLATKISSLASELGVDELAQDPFIFVDDQLNDYFERKRKFNTLFAEEIMPSLEEEMRVNPESALETLKSYRSQMPTSEYESALEKITQRLSVINDLKIGRFEDKQRDIEKQASNILAAVDPMQGIAYSSAFGIKQEEVIRVAELTEFGENEFRMLATDNVEQRIQADPTLKDPERQTEYTSVVNEAVGAAYTETLKRMEERKKQMDAEKAVNGTGLDESEAVKTYGKGARMVSDAKEAVESVSKLDPRGETTAETAQFKVTLDRAKRQLPDLARQIKLSSGEQRTQLEATYKDLLKITGLGVDTVLLGKTEDGIAMDLSEVQENWDAIPVFRDVQEFSSVIDEDIQSGKQGGGGDGSLVDFVIREEAGADQSYFYPTPKWDYKQWTIGYGTKARGKNDRVTPQEAKQRLVEELDEHAIRVDTALEQSGLLLNENQRNALISFDFNTGAGRKVILDSKGDITYIQNKILEYTKVTPDQTKPNVKVDAAGLVARRKKELDLFNGVTQPTTVSTSKLQQLIEKLGIPMEAAEVARFIDSQKRLINQRTFNTSF